MIIYTTLTTSGNSVAVRLPKSLLQMSGLKDKVTLQARKGKIIISKPINPREGWDSNIKSMLKKYGDPSEEFADINNVLADEELDNLSWNGITYEKWLKDNDKLS